MEEHDYSCLSKKDFASLPVVNKENGSNNDAGKPVGCESKPTMLLNVDDKGARAEDDQYSQFQREFQNVKVRGPSLNEDFATVFNGKSEVAKSVPASEHLSNRNGSEQFCDTIFPLALEPNPKKRSSENDEVGEYYFESDHLALRGNSDYLALIKSIAILESQRTRAIKDLQRLYDAQEEALCNPIAFVEKLQCNENLKLPSNQKIHNLPSIDWDRYVISFNPNVLNNRRIITRRQIAEPAKQNDFPEASWNLPLNNVPLRPCNQSGNIQSEGRSQTYNQAWTAEEQKRLEELLVKFPPEDIESRRWEKIAQALGNRSRQQVASRVQKYFIKLTKAGLPVPGRTPNISNYVKRGHGHRHQRHNRYLFQPSTFFASYDPPVYMGENDDDTISSCNISTTSSLDGDNNDKPEAFTFQDDIPLELKATEEYKELLQLMKIRKDKLQSSGLPQHIGFKCDNCECEPIVGTRWHCADCPPDSAVDFCEDCADCMQETSTHLNTHRLLPIAGVSMKPYVDVDYATFMPGNYNYLDPNYMPAT